MVQHTDINIYLDTTVKRSHYAVFVLDGQGDRSLYAGQEADDVEEVRLIANPSNLERSPGFSRVSPPKRHWGYHS